MRALTAIIAILFLGCGTRLSGTDLEAEQATQSLGASGYRDHVAEGGLDLIRYQAIFCNSSEIMARAGSASTLDAGVQCPGVP